MKFYVATKPVPGSRRDYDGRIDLNHADSLLSGDAPRCPACGRIIGLRQWLPPYRLEMETWGRHYGDFECLGEDWVISERLRDLFLCNNLKGLTEFEEVDIVRITYRRGKPEGSVPRYFKAVVDKQHVTVDQQASGMQWAPNYASADEMTDKQWGLGALGCSVCLWREGTFVRLNKLVILPETWTGEDVFHARGGVDNIVSHRLVTICEAGNIKGVQFTPADQFEIDYYPSEMKCLRREYGTYMDRENDRESRQDAYRTMAAIVGRAVDFGVDFDPDRDVEQSVINAIGHRLRATPEN
ncbi:MAG: hypothetical protein K1X57_16280 [Gemmataceae bacterium]|nr:hypothetical protein [Gemmataceae bacterium]